MDSRFGRCFAIGVFLVCLTSQSQCQISTTSRSRSSSNPDLASSLQVSSSVQRFDATLFPRSTVHIYPANSNCASPLTPPANGTVSCTNGTVVGSVCSFNCSTDYLLSGSTTRTCNISENSAYWDGSDTNCSVSHCSSSLSSPADGNVSCTHDREVGSVCTFNCSMNYQLSGSSMRTCTESGNSAYWSGSESLCSVYQCASSLSPPVDGNVSCTRGREVGSVCTFNCFVNYQLSGSTTRTCNASGNSAYWSGSESLCSVSHCASSLASPTYGNVSCSLGREVGSMCTFSCSPDYQLYGSVERTCVMSGNSSNWTGSETDCIVSHCESSLASPDHGSVSCTSGREVGSVCSFGCSKYYELSGPPSTTCTDYENVAYWSDPQQSGSQASCSALWCEEDVYHLPNSSSINITFPRTMAGVTISAQFFCNASDSRSAIRTCGLDNNGQPSWQDPDYTPCPQTQSASQAIDRLSNVNVTENNVEMVAEDLADLTSKSDTLDDDTLSNVASVLTSVVAITSDSVNITEENIAEVSENVISVVDNVLDIPEEQYQNTDEGVSDAIRNTIYDLTETIQETTSGNFTYNGSNIVVAAVKVERTKFPLSAGIGASSLGGAIPDDAFEFTANDENPSNKEDEVSVSIPEEILQHIPDPSGPIALSVFMVNSDKLFQTSGSTSSSKATPSPGQPQPSKQVVASPILSVTVEGANISNLESPVVFAFPLNQSLFSDNSIGQEVSCVFWDEDKNGGDWSTWGCQKDDQTSTKELISCQCTHLTSFAVLVDIKGSILSEALDTISMIGCITSIICLIITIGLMLGIKRLRTKHPQQILINLCFALLGLYLVFVIGIDRPSWGIGCVVVAVLIHFFCMAAISWMGVEAFSMYLMFVKVMNTYTPNLLLKSCLVGWGVPLGIVITTVAVDWTAYRNPAYCFLKPDNSFYFGMLLPMAIILTINFMIYVVVLYKLTCGRKAPSQSVQSQSIKKKSIRLRDETKRRVQNAIAIGTLLGVTWLLGFLTIGHIRHGLSALFTIFNSMQGVFIFILFGVRQPEVKELVRKAFRRMAAPGVRKDSNSYLSFDGTKSTSASVPLKCAEPSKNTNVTLISYTIRSSGEFSEKV